MESTGWTPLPTSCRSLPKHSACNAPRQHPNCHKCDGRIALPAWNRSLNVFKSCYGVPDLKAGRVLLVSLCFTWVWPSSTGVLVHLYIRSRINLIVIPGFSTGALECILVVVGLITSRNLVLVGVWSGLQGVSFNGICLSLKLNDAVGGVSRARKLCRKLVRVKWRNGTTKPWNFALV